MLEAYRPALLRAVSVLSRSGLDRNDLEQEAAIALLEAVRSFDSSRARSLGALAPTKIHAALRRHAEQLGGAIAVSGSSRAQRARKERATIRAEIDRLVRDDGLSLEQATQIACRAWRISPENLAEAEAGTMGVPLDVAGDLLDGGPSPEEAAIAAEEDGEREQRMSSAGLTPAERDVVQLLMAGQTVKQAARQLGMTTPRVQRLFESATAKLQAGAISGV